MDAAEWKREIVKACKEAGTFKPCFWAAIDALADILEKRDNAQEMFEKTGGQTVVRHTNKAGATNITKNPALAIIMDLNAQALAYWRDLGLTPAGLKRIDEKAAKAPRKSALAEALESLGG